MRMRFGVVGAALLAILLTGCSSVQSYRVLENEPTTKDVLPTLASYAYQSLDEESARWVGTHGGAELYLARGVEAKDHICLVVAAQDWVVGCGGAEIGVGTRGLYFHVLPDGATPPSGTVTVSDNVYARE